MEHMPAVMQQPSSLSFAASSTNLMELSAFMMEQLKTQMVEQRAHDKEQHAEVVRLLEGRLEQQQEELAKQHKELDEHREHALEVRLREQAVNSKMVGLLQVRLDALHSAKLLEDEEVYTIEDIIADSETDDIRVSQLIALSDKMKSDKAFARQLRRKYC